MLHSLLITVSAVLVSGGPEELVGSGGHGLREGREAARADNREKPK